MTVLVPVCLGSASTFSLGRLEVRPSTRQVITGSGRSITVEPRVLQVLVALAEAKGEVVSRENLLERCWNGRVVGEGAIHRVISLIRDLASSAGEDSFSIETIPRVGYRLVERVSEPVPAAAGEPVDSSGEPGSAGPLSRRGVMAGAVLAVAGLSALGGTIVVLRRPRADQSPADDLADRGQFSMRLQGEQWAEQSIRYLERAVELDPRSARAWAALAIAYSLALSQADDGAVPGLVRHCEAAATRALDLAADGDSRRLVHTGQHGPVSRWPPALNARIALANCGGPFRRWATMERNLEAVIAESEGHPMPAAGLANLMMQVGRMRDAVEQWEAAYRLDPHIPVTSAGLARSLWSLGRAIEAEAVLARAVSMLPPHPLTFHAQFDIKLFDGRISGAGRVLESMAALGPAAPLPQALGRDLLEIASRRNGSLLPDAEERLVAACAPGGLPVNVGARYLAAFGAADSAFRLLDCYYFGGRLPSGHALSPPPPFARRNTDELFLPTAQSLRAHPRFAALTARLGLDDYWHATGSRPQVAAPARQQPQI